MKTENMQENWNMTEFKGANSTYFRETSLISVITNVVPYQNTFGEPTQKPAHNYLLISY